MNRLIWFFGCSASGKETLIKHIYSGQDKKLNSNLGIDLRKTIILDKSIQYISKHRTDNITKKRFEIVHDILTLCSKKVNEYESTCHKSQNNMLGILEYEEYIIRSLSFMNSVDKEKMYYKLIRKYLDRLKIKYEENSKKILVLSNGRVYNLDYKER